MATLRQLITHDFHKIHGIAHDSNDVSIPNNVDQKASHMSRPKNPAKIEKDDADVINNYRISLISGQSFYAHSNEEKELILEKEREYLENKETDSELYERLLLCGMLSKFNEAIFKINEEEGWGLWLPYTSLKYHSVLVSSLHWNINIKNREFDDLYFKIVNKENVDDIFSIVLLDDVNKKCLTISDLNTNEKYEAITKIGDNPMMNFGDVMSRLRGEVYIDKYVYSNLRRIKSWSIGLQYYDDILHNHDDAFNRVSL